MSQVGLLESIQHHKASQGQDFPIIMLSSHSFNLLKEELQMSYPGGYMATVNEIWLNLPLGSLKVIRGSKVIKPVVRYGQYV